MPESRRSCDFSEASWPVTVNATTQMPVPLRQSSQDNLARRSVRAYYRGRCPVRGVVSIGLTVHSRPLAHRVAPVLFGGAAKKLSLFSGQLSVIRRLPPPCADGLRRLGKIPGCGGRARRPSCETDPRTSSACEPQAATGTGTDTLTE
jgi:hypothetical protein